MPTWPSLRSFFSCARRTRMSLALLERLHPLVERTEGSLGLRLRGDHLSGRVYQVPESGQGGTFCGFCRFFSDETTDRTNKVCRSGYSRAFVGASSSLRIRPGAIGSENRIVPSATALAPTATSSRTWSPGADSAHAYDRQLGRRSAQVHRGESDGSQRRSRVAPHFPRKPRSERHMVEGKAAHGVHQRQAIRSGRSDRLGGRCEIPLRWRELRVERLGCRRFSLQRRARPPSRVPRRRWGTRG